MDQYVTMFNKLKQLTISLTNTYKYILLHSNVRILINKEIKNNTTNSTWYQCIRRGTLHGSYEKALVMIDVLFIIANIAQFKFLRTLGKDAFQENF